MSEERKPRRRWGEVKFELSQRPGEWSLVATDVPASLARYLQTKWGLETRVEHVGTNGRAEKLYARMPVTALARNPFAKLREAIEVLLHEMDESPRAQARDFLEEVEAVKDALEPFRCGRTPSEEEIAS